MTDGTPPIRQATEADVESFGRILGAAFEDDPIINWIVRQDERRREAIETLFREVGPLRLPVGRRVLRHRGRQRRGALATTRRA